jgi:hypothetical protein
MLHANPVRIEDWHSESNWSARLSFETGVREIERTDDRLTLTREDGISREIDLVEPADGISGLNAERLSLAAMQRLYKTRKDFLPWRKRASVFLLLLCALSVLPALGIPRRFAERYLPPLSLLAAVAWLLVSLYLGLIYFSS